MISGRRFSIGVLTLAFILGLFVITQSQTITPVKYTLPLTLGSTSTYETLTVIRTCSLSQKYDTVPVLQVKKTLATDDELLVLAKKYGVISSSAKIRDFGGGDKVLFGNGKSFHTHGLDHFMLSSDGETRLNNTMSEESAKKVADEFVAGLLKDNPDYSCTIEYLRTVTGSRRISTNLETGEKKETIHTLKVKYKLYYDGIPIYGNGAAVSVTVCNFRIVGLEVHLPKIFFKHKTSDYKTPDQAFQEMLDSPKLSFGIRFNRDRNESTFIERHVDTIELCYYYQFTHPETETELQLYYLISGTDYLKTSKGIVKEDTFTALIPATRQSKA